MTIHDGWKLIKDNDCGVTADTLLGALHICFGEELPGLINLLVDVASTHYSTLQSHHNDMQQLLDKITAYYSVPDGPQQIRIILVFDGAPAIEKKSTYLARQRKVVSIGQQIERAKKTLAKAKERNKRVHVIEDINHRIQALESRSWRPSNQWIAALTTTVQGRQPQHGVELVVSQAPFEADLWIATSHSQYDNCVTVTMDSDLVFGYNDVSRVIRPYKGKLQSARRRVLILGKGNHYLVMRRERVLQRLSLTPNALTALAVVAKNDYSRNIPTIGVVRALRSMQGLCKRNGSSTWSTADFVREFLGTSRVVKALARWKEMHGLPDEAVESIKAEQLVSLGVFNDLVEHALDPADLVLVPTNYQERNGTPPYERHAHVGPFTIKTVPTEFQYFTNEECIQARPTHKPHQRKSKRQVHHPRGFYGGKVMDPPRAGAKKRRIGQQLQIRHGLKRTRATVTRNLGLLRNQVPTLIG